MEEEVIEISYQNPAANVFPKNHFLMHPSRDIEAELLDIENFIEQEAEKRVNFYKQSWEQRLAFYKAQDTLFAKLKLVEVTDID